MPLNRTQKIYLDLLKRAVTGYLYIDDDHFAQNFAKSQGHESQNSRSTSIDGADTKKRRALRRQGKDWPGVGVTMCGFKRLNNLASCISSVHDEKVPGDIIEAGVWRGGASIFARGVLKLLGVTDRKIWVADSFEGLPRPESEKYPEDAGSEFYKVDYLKVSLEEVKRNFELFGMLDEQVEFIPGYFEDTLKDAPIQKIAVARLDGDMYSSTISSLDALYHKISPGGYLIIDDYSLDECKAAVSDFRAEHGIQSEIREIDWTGIYWRVD